MGELKLRRDNEWILIVDYSAWDAVVGSNSRSMVALRYTEAPTVPGWHAVGKMVDGHGRAFDVKLSESTRATVLVEPTAVRPRIITGMPPLLVALTREKPAGQIECRVRSLGHTDEWWFDFDDIVKGTIGWPVVNYWWRDVGTDIAVQVVNAWTVVRFLSTFMSMRKGVAYVMGALPEPAVEIMDPFRIVIASPAPAIIVRNLLARQNASGKPQGGTLDFDEARYHAMLGRLRARYSHNSKDRQLTHSEWVAPGAPWSLAKAGDSSVVFIFAASGAGKTTKLRQIGWPALVTVDVEVKPSNGSVHE